MKNLSFYKNKKVLITGHTGFKGAVLSRILSLSGAEVVGYSLMPPTEPNLYTLISAEDDLVSIYGDVRDSGHLSELVGQIRPDIIFHLAAQPLVLYSYLEPRLTFETNIMGTVNLLEAVRRCGCVRSFVNITTDKVYQNDESKEAFTEDMPLNGYDPYSSSKSCSDLVTQSYRSSFFGKTPCAVSTVRAGNVIGGGDYAENRLIPDCVRAAEAGKPIILRHPDSVRPFQHVLEPLSAYLLLAEKQYGDKSLEGAYNIGPDRSDCVSTKTLTEYFCEAWNRDLPEEKKITYAIKDEGGPHEAHFLSLDSSKIRTALGWTPKWNIRKAAEETCSFEKTRIAGGDVRACLDRQIEEYFGEGMKEECSKA